MITESDILNADTRTEQEVMCWEMFGTSLQEAINQGYLDPSLVHPEEKKVISSSEYDFM